MLISFTIIYLDLTGFFSYRFMQMNIFLWLFLLSCYSALTFHGHLVNWAPNMGGKGCDSLNFRSMLVSFALTSLRYSNNWKDHEIWLRKKIQNDVYYTAYDMTYLVFEWLGTLQLLNLVEMWFDFVNVTVINFFKTWSNRGLADESMFLFRKHQLGDQLLNDLIAHG